MENSKNVDENIKNIDFKQISKNITSGFYKCVGIGSGRIVFDLGNGYVVKVARNYKGIGQNEAEYRISMADDSGLLANITAVSKGLTFLIMDKADRINDISFVWKHFNVKNNQELYQTQKLQEISRSYNLLVWDFGKAVNWGQINGKPIIVDYGYTKEVRRRFYLPPFFRINKR
ncbi:MAG: hypothetical protein Q8942_02850 [Bacillota bacterium]|nr:hypothetical protein [Bacillota bacterium]